MSVERAPEAGTSGSSVKVTGASIDNLSERDASERHVPVMLDRCINLLAPGIERAVEERGTAYVIDGTLGMGGHSEALLERFENLVLIGIDRDLQAHSIAGSVWHASASVLCLYTRSTTKSTAPWKPPGCRELTASCWTWASPPCSWTNAPVASRTPTTHPWTCA